MAASAPSAAAAAAAAAGDAAAVAAVAATASASGGGAGAPTAATVTPSGLRDGIAADADLAAYHEPVSDFLALSGDEWPLTPAAIAKYALTAEQVASYERDGYIDGVRVLNEAQVARLRAELAEIMDPAHPKHKLWHEYNENEAGAASGKALFHSLGAWCVVVSACGARHCRSLCVDIHCLFHTHAHSRRRRISPAFHDLLFLPAYLVPAMQVVGVGALRLWHDQVFAKPPHNGSVVAWHQDYRCGAA